MGNELATVVEGLPVVNPRTGELVHPQDLEGLCRLILTIQDYEREFATAKSSAMAAILAERERLGLSQTIKVGRFTATVGSPAPKIDWDFEILERLMEAGLPRERYDEFVEVKTIRKPNMTVGRQIAAANPEYSAIIAAASEKREERPPRVSVK